MRELLDGMHELAAAPTPARRREVESVVQSYSTLVAQRIEKLRDRLAAAKALQNTLDDLLL